MSFAVLTGTKKLQVVLGAAVNSTECPINVNYRDHNSVGSSPASADAITTGDTEVDVVPAAPAGIRRELESFSLYNDDDAEINVSVVLYVNSSTSRVLWKGDIQTDECLFYNESRGWYATDSNANQKSNAVGSSGASSEALSAATSAGVRASTALSAATSQNLAQSTVISGVLSSATSQDLAQSVDVSTALSTALSAAESA